jgi:alcohol dehydrogenase class IV
VPIPADRINGVPLTWPLGTYDFEELTGRQFDFDTYKTIPQFICRGENDLGDVRKYLDQYSLDQAHIVIDQFGDNSITQLRFLHEYLRSVGIHAKLKIYDDLAHELSATMIHDAFEFFEAHKAD